MWPDAREVLDFEAQPQGYLLWKSTARGYPLGKFPHVGRVLDWGKSSLSPSASAMRRTSCWASRWPRSAG
eukprot:13911545-Alexandrium_andersonii.AAC.1